MNRDTAKPDTQKKKNEQDRGPRGVASVKGGVLLHERWVMAVVRGARRRTL